MREFLRDLDALYGQIVDNQIGRLTPGLSKDAFISAYTNAVDVQYRLRQKTVDLLENRLYPMLVDIVSLSDEDEAELFETAQKLSSYSNRLDPMLALKIYRKLLERARARRDDSLIIKYLYWCGVTTFFITSTRKDIEQDKKTAAYFEAASAYADRYDTFDDPETRQYIHRCMGNKSMMYYRIYSPAAAIREEEANFAFWNNLIFSGKDTDFPWLSYFMLCLNHRHTDMIRRLYTHLDSISKDACNSLLELTMTINKLYNRNRKLYDAFGGARYEFYLWRAQFLSGLISFDHLRKNTQSLASKFADDDFSSDAIFIRIHSVLHFISFLANMPQLKEQKEQLLPEMLDDTLRHLSSLPMTVDPSIVSDLLNDFTQELASHFTPAVQMEIILKLTAHRHIQMCAHGEMVSRLSVFLTKRLLESAPESFVGCLGISTAIDALSQADDLCAFAKTAALCHDIGVLSYASNPFMNVRGLTDDEFEVVMQHPVKGAAFLKRSDGSALNKGYTDVVLGHHKFYDNTGGYPKEFDRNSSDVAIMVDIVSIANRIDASTDNISKTAKEAMSVNGVCKFILSEAGRRFSPVVSSLLEDNGFLSEIEDLLSEGRKDAYYRAYLMAWET